MSYILACAVSCTSIVAWAGEPYFNEPFRPVFHFTPAENWANDPNGLVFFDGEYHLFYQHNPLGIRWGHMSWGHAVSRDLVHWDHLPVALRETDEFMAFSGSAVVDRKNTSRFGSEGRPPLVAVYTAYRPDSGHQSQYIAYSLDRGRTWTQYSDNPVLDINSTDFRDPKVFWYEPDGKWLMVIALPTERKVRFYSSEDLKTWKRLSDFGPAGAIGGAWECPDLFELPVKGLPGQTRWVLQVDLDRRAFAGGSGGQYFIGTFDGQRFVTDAPPPKIHVPHGESLGAFDNGTLGTWAIEGKAFGTGPGKAVGMAGAGCLHSGANGDNRLGRATSPSLVLNAGYLNFLVGGGRDAERLAVELLVDDQVVRSTTGFNGDVLDWVSWDIAEFRGRKARVRIRDESDGLWGHLVADQFMLSRLPARSSIHRGRWVDYGKDFYAVTSWSNTPSRRIWLAWMNNWHYGQDLPTAPWRSAMTIPRQVGLRVAGGGIRLVQTPVSELNQLRGEEFRLDSVVLDGERELSLRGTSLEIEAVFDPGDAAAFGLVVFQNDQHGTEIGYDRDRCEIYVDRTRSGNTDFHPLFSSRIPAPLEVNSQGLVRLHIFLDRSSVEVFGNNGVVSMTNRVFPPRNADKITAFAREGKARLVSLRGWKMRSSW
jgi:beta-fructofuranosidase/levanase